MIPLQFLPYIFHSVLNTYLTRITLVCVYFFNSFHSNFDPFFQFYTKGWYLFKICTFTLHIQIFQEAYSRPCATETTREESHLSWKQGGRGGHHGCDRQTQEITFQLSTIIYILSSFKDLYFTVLRRATVYRISIQLIKSLFFAMHCENGHKWLQF